MCKELARKVKKIKILQKKQKKTEIKELLNRCILSYKAYFSVVIELKKMTKEKFLKYKGPYYKKANDFLNSLLRNIIILWLNYEIELLQELTWIKSRKEFKKALQIFKADNGEKLLIQNL